jgi:hypothetical protein
MEDPGSVNNPKFHGLIPLFIFLAGIFAALILLKLLMG